MTTGGGQQRFNPNLYACGKVCLSLLGTWAGQNPTQNWTKLSTLQQVLISIQSLIMGFKYPYFNEPGREQEYTGDPLDERLTLLARTDHNGGYEQLRVGTIRIAMIGQLQRPAAGFEETIRRHFYCKVSLHNIQWVCSSYSSIMVANIWKLISESIHRLAET